jgi:hypothetical protein
VFQNKQLELPLESTLAKVFQNKQLELPLESTLDEKQEVGEG